MRYLILTLLLSKLVTSDTTPSSSANAMSQPYDYTESNWPDICKIGEKQTPIDLNPSKAQVISNNTVISILSNSYSIIRQGVLENHDNHKFGLDLSGTDSLYVLKGGLPYQYYLLGFHIHFASEHTVEAKSMDMELHLVHGKNKNSLKEYNITDPDTNDYLVVGIMFKSSPTAENHPILQSMNWDTRAPITSLDLRPFVKPTKNFYHYSGSLTTPGCIEKVNWVVMDEVENMSTSQFNAIKNWLQTVYPKGNARTVKELKGRTLYYIRNSNAKNIGFSLFALLIFAFLII
jgi:carbonic anhydrase